MDLELLRQELTRDEELRQKPYRDSVGKLTIGIGHNLDDKGLSLDAVHFIYQEDVAEHMSLLDRHLPWWRNVDEVRQRAIMNLAFNLGVGPSDEHPKGKLLEFKNTLAAMSRGDWEAAANGLSASKWAGQVGIRATRIIQMIRTGSV